MVGRPKQVATDTEEVEYQAVHREKPLRVRSGCKPAHLAFALARRLMRHLRSIVLVLASAVNHGRHDGVVGR